MVSTKLELPGDSQGVYICGLQMLYKKAAPKNFTNIRRKNLYWSRYSSNHRPKGCNLIRVGHGCFAMVFVKLVKTPLCRTSENSCFSTLGVV